MIERLYDLSLYIYFSFSPFIYFIKASIVVLSIYVSQSYSPDEGLLKPKRFNADFPLR